jgi:hypothetical protein
MSPAPTFNDGLTKGRNASSAISKGRFVVIDTTAADGESVLQASSPTGPTPPIGVSKFSVSTTEIGKGKGCSVVMDGIALVEAGSALTEGQVVTVDSSGRAVVAVAGNWVCGYVNEPAAGAGSMCSVFLTDPGTKFS